MTISLRNLLVEGLKFIFNNLVIKNKRSIGLELQTLSPKAKCRAIYHPNIILEDFTNIIVMFSLALNIA